MKHIFTIPTNRLVKKSFDSLLKEIKIFSSLSNDPFEVLILDNSLERVSEKNKSYIQSVSKETKFKILHLDLKDQLLIINELNKLTSLDLTEMLYPIGVDYGRMYNILFISTMLMGGSYFHRRDSDCYVLDLPSSIYPVVAEEKFLGKRVIDCKEMFISINNSNFSSDDEFLVVGSDYIGDWNLDLSELESVDQQLVIDLLKVMGVPEEDAKLNLKYKYSSKQDHGSRDVLLPILKDGFNVHQYPECGNISIKEIFKYIPNFVGSHGIGYDYHTQFISFLLKVPTLYHQNKINHKHENARKEISRKISYWEGIIKQVDLDLLWTNFIKFELPKLIDKKLTGLSGIKVLAETILPDCLERSYKAIRSEDRAKYLDEIIRNILFKSKLDEYRIIANQIKNREKDIFDEIDKDYEVSIELQRTWNRIEKACESLRIDEFIYSL